MARQFIDRIEGVGDVFALTFDDGPSARWTPRLLDALAAEQAQVTFFPLAKNLRREQAIARRALAAGHEYGVHGELHLPPPPLPWALLRWDTQRGIAAAQGVGVTPRWYRPAFDLLTDGQSERLRAMGLAAVRGDIDPADYNQPPAALIASRVLAKLRPGSIVVMHDASGLGDFDRSQSVMAAAAILAEARTRGLRCVTVSALLARPGARPDVTWALPGTA